MMVKNRRLPGLNLSFPIIGCANLSKLSNHAIPQFHICKMGVICVITNMCKRLATVSVT